MSSSMKSSCEKRSSVPSCSARTSPPLGGIFVCWSQPRIDRAMCRSWMEARRVLSSSYVFVTGMSLRRSVLPRSLLEEFFGVDAARVPEEEPLGVMTARGVDLRLHLLGRSTVAREREVLEPRDQHRLAADQRVAEVAERARDRAAGHG